ncbi:hypothetical protein ACQP00_28080 [Dactylosporangium sp. CS-047395]|uniref:hypothetical protein n=1 Tax=Dactylosporangium sp. CS-047395 TaxID=3239936 RepID=UPI003D9428AD
MSLTQQFGVFGALGQAGVNKALATFLTVRPRYLHYASPPFAGTTSVAVTAMSPIAFPGVPGGIAWAVDFTLPIVDLFPADAALPAPLTLQQNQLAVTTQATITVGCLRGDPKDDRHQSVTPVRTTLDVVALGHPVSRYFSPGVGDVGLVVDQVAIEKVEPQTLAGLLECLVRSLLNGALSQVRLPFDVIDGGFFKLVLQSGPAVADDQVKLWGGVA